MATKQKKKPARSTVRQDASRRPWTKKAPPLRFGREEFRFRLYRTGRRLPAVDIDPWVETCSWGRQGGIRTGELNFRRPLAEHAASMIAAGDEIRCEVAVYGSAGGWRRLWRLKVATPSHQIREGIMALSLATGLDALTKSKVAWKFRKGKRKPRGWTAREITERVAQRFDVKVGTLPKAKHRITKLVETSMSPYDVLVKAWKEERRHTGRRFDIDVSSGELNVVELREPRYMLVVGDTATDATLEQSLAGLASAIVATATRKDTGEKKPKKLRVKVVDAKRRRRFGYIVKTLKAPKGIDSIAELRKWAKRRLAETHKAKKTVQFTHPGLPFVDRGDVLRLRLPEAEFDEIVFITDVRHHLSAGSYTMDVTVGFDNPWAADRRKKRAKRKKAAAAARRGRAGGESAAPRTPKKATTRSDK